MVTARVGGSTELAEDIISEAYARAMKYFNCFNPEVNHFSAWFHKILNNVSRDVQRRERNSGMTMREEESVEVRFDLPFAKEYIQNEMDNITNEVHAEIIHHYYINELKPREIYEIMEGVKPTTIRKVAQRFCDVLKEKYK